MIEGRTKSGFKYKLDERIGTDWRVLRAIALVENGDTSAQVKGTTDLVRLILGDDEQRLIDHIAKKNDGFVPTSVVTDEITQILTNTNETKN